MVIIPNGADAQANVGIGTTSPDAPLTVHSSSDPEIRLGYSSSQDHKISWDSSKLFINADPDNANSNSALGFRVDGSEAGRFDASGNLLVGTTTVSLYNNSSEVGTRIGDGVLMVNRSANTPAYFNRLSTNGAVIQFRMGGTAVGDIAVTSSATTYNTSSDARLKDVTGQARGLDVINALNPVSYNWKADGKADEGLIAQEVQEIVPNAVSQNAEEYYQMDYSKLVTPLIKAVQELSNEVNELKQQVQNLKGE